MHFMSLLNVSWFALYRQLDWFKISISVLSANREIEMKHHNWLFTNCFYWLKKTVYGPTYWSTGIFIQLFPMRRECLWQHAAAWRKGAVPSVLFLRALCGRFKHFKMKTSQHAGHHRTFSWKRRWHSQNFCVLQIMSCNHILLALRLIAEAVAAGTSPSSSPLMQGMRASILCLGLLVRKKQTIDNVKHIDKTHM